MFNTLEKKNVEKGYVSKLRVQLLVDHIINIFYRHWILQGVRQYHALFTLKKSRHSLERILRKKVNSLQSPKTEVLSVPL